MPRYALFRGTVGDPVPRRGMASGGGRSRCEGNDCGGVRESGGGVGGPYGMARRGGSSPIFMYEKPETLSACASERVFFSRRKEKGKSSRHSLA